MFEHQYRYLNQKVSRFSMKPAVLEDSDGTTEFLAPKTYIQHIRLAYLSDFTGPWHLGQISTITCRQHVRCCQKGLCHPLSHHHIAAGVASILSCTSCYHPRCHRFFFAAALHCDMEPNNTTATVDHQADGTSPDDDVDRLLTQDPLAVSTNPEHLVCPDLPPLEGTEQYHSHGTAFHLPSAKHRRPGRF